MRSHAAERVENGVVQSGQLARLAQPQLIGPHVGEVQRVGGAQAGIDPFVARFQQKVDPRASAELEVVLALGADHQVGFEIGLIERLAATGTFDP